MNRRLFCAGLLAAPVAAIAWPQRAPLLIHKGNSTGRWRAGCAYSHGLEYNNTGPQKWLKVGDHTVGLDGRLYRVTNVIHDETIMELVQ